MGLGGVVVVGGGGGGGGGGVGNHLSCSQVSHSVHCFHCGIFVLLHEVCK